MQTSSAPDSKRFAVAEDASPEQTGPRQLTLRLNSYDELRRAPSGGSCFLEDNSRAVLSVSDQQARHEVSGWRSQAGGPVQIGM